MHGQLGDGSAEGGHLLRHAPCKGATALVEIACGGWCTVARSAIGDVWLSGWLGSDRRLLELTLVESLAERNATHVSAGARHFAVACDDGSVFLCGTLVLGGDAVGLAPLRRQGVWTSEVPVRVASLQAMPRLLASGSQHVVLA